MIDTKKRTQNRHDGTLCYLAPSEIYKAKTAAW